MDPLLAWAVVAGVLGPALLVAAAAGAGWSARGVAESGAARLAAAQLAAAERRAAAAEAATQAGASAAAGVVAVRDALATATPSDEKALVTAGQPAPEASGRSPR